MAIWDSLLRRGQVQTNEQSRIIEDLDSIHENVVGSQTVSEIHIDEDNSDNSLLYGDIESITESVVHHSPESLNKLITNSDFSSGQLLDELKANYSLDNTFMENEEMSRDSVVGGAMETISDDACQIDERTRKYVTVESTDEALSKFLQDFLDYNVKISQRLWTWTFEIVKHGDLKLRRCEYYIGDRQAGIKSVYYEDIVNPYKVTRIEYMGQVLGYRDEDKREGNVSFEKPEEFVHFMSVKNSKREKVTLAYRNGQNEVEEVDCYKVCGTSIVDNARYIFRIVNLLDNMLVLSRVARSSQFNLVKVEVGNASPQKTQQILGDVRRRLEGSTKMKKNQGMKTDVSPIPVNSNVYIPTRDGKGEISVESVGDTVDVRSITDIDYFKDKEFATLKVPKMYLGFGDDATGSLANNSLVRMDARYARTVQRVQQILVEGITELCRNYLQYRGRSEDATKFTIRVRPLDTNDTMNRVEEISTQAQAFDSFAGVLESFGQYIDKAKFFISTANLIGLNPSDIGSEELLQIIKEIEEGTYKEENHVQEVPDEEEGGW